MSFDKNNLSENSLFSGMPSLQFKGIEEGTQNDCKAIK